MATTIGDDASTNLDGTHNTFAVATVNLPNSTLGGTTVCPVLSGAMTQLASNQAAMMTHMAALQIAPTHPPLQQIMIPQQQYMGGGRGGQGGNCGYVDRGASYNIPNTGFVGCAPPPTGGFTTGRNHSGGRGRGRRQSSAQKLWHSRRSKPTTTWNVTARRHTTIWRCQPDRPLRWCQPNNTYDGSQSSETIRKLELLFLVWF